MKDVIYLVINRYKVQRMAKNLPMLSKGEHVLKVEVEVMEEAYRDPTVVKKVIVNDWREGIDIADVDFKETFITEDEAATIRAQRLERMREVLESQGYKIEKPEETDESIETPTA